MSEVVKVGELAQPISPERPAGSDLREDLTPASPYRAIKDLRNKNRSIERRMDEGFEVDPPDWSGVLRTAIDILQSKSKDLEVACWAIEALARLDGFEGLAQGFQLLNTLVRDHWDGIYPLPEGDDSSYRLAPLANLNGVDTSEGTLIWPINRIPLFIDKNGNELARWHYRQALMLESRDPEARQRLVAEGAATSEKLQLAANDTKPEACRATHQAIASALASFTELSTTLSAKCGNDAVPTSTIQTALEECRKVIEIFAGAKLSGTSSLANGTEDRGKSIPKDTSVGSASVSGNREQILHTVEQCAAALRALEPQSLIPAVLERSVRWARLPVDQLLREVIKEDGALDGITRLTGVNYYTPPEKSQ